MQLVHAQGKVGPSDTGHQHDSLTMEQSQPEVPPPVLSPVTAQSCGLPRAVVEWRRERPEFSLPHKSSLGIVPVANEMHMCGACSLQTTTFVSRFKSDHLPLDRFHLN